MTPDHGDYVLAKLSVVFPNKALNVEEVRFWVEKLEPFEFDHAMLAVGKISDTCRFWPSWAEFKEVLEAVRPRTYELAPVEGTPVSKEEARAYMAEIRETMRRG